MEERSGATAKTGVQGIIFESITGHPRDRVVQTADCGKGIARRKVLEPYHRAPMPNQWSVWHGKRRHNGMNEPRRSRCGEGYAVCADVAALLVTFGAVAKSHPRRGAERSPRAGAQNRPFRARGHEKNLPRARRRETITQNRDGPPCGPSLLVYRANPRLAYSNARLTPSAACRSSPPASCPGSGRSAPARSAGSPPGASPDTCSDSSRS